MITIATKADGTSLIEVTPKESWTPAMGQVFYVPNIVSNAKPTLDFDWSNNANDRALLDDGLVCRTEKEALDLRYTLRAFSRILKG